MKAMIIPATAERQRLIQGIVKNLKSKGPSNSRIEYYYTLKAKQRGSSFLSEEQNGIFREVSILNVNYSKILFAGIKTVMENETGNVVFQHKPFLMSQKRALRKIDEFLRKLQPESLEKRKYGIASVEHSDSSVRVERDMDFGGYRVSYCTVSAETLDKGGPKEAFPFFANS